MVKKFAAILTVALLSSFPAISHADTMSFTGSGSGTDGALAASATFVTGNGTITVTLSNTLDAQVIRSAGQALSDITFDVSGTPGAISGATSSGQMGNIDSSKKLTDVSGNPDRWLGAGGQGNFGISGNTVTLETIGGGQPSEMIIPFLANGGTYGNINNGFNNFNAYEIGPATFVIDIAGVNSDTKISNVQFSFGTGPDTFLEGTPSRTPTTPEPSSLMLLGTGMLAAAGALRKRFV